jgi:hypothetical protein
MKSELRRITHASIIELHSEDVRQGTMICRARQPPLWLFF